MLDNPAKTPMYINEEKHFNAHLLPSEWSLGNKFARLKWVRTLLTIQIEIKRPMVIYVIFNKISTVCWV